MEPGMTCLSNPEFIRRFNTRTAQLRVPVSGSVDLTHRCNLRCVHCYLGEQGVRNKRRSDELTTRRALSILDEITDAGCLFLLMTGGEPLLRYDFDRIYRKAKENGLLVTVFTNGTLISDEILELFNDLPPYCIEVSMYGSTPQTYESITGVSGSYEKCLIGIRRLLEHKMNVRVKTILMTLNRHEFFDMENIAKDLGIKFRFDAAIFPRSDGDKTPLSLRIPPGEAVEKEFSDAERFRLWRDYYEASTEQLPSDSLYTCGAGRTGFHIDPYGNLFPCLMMPDIKYNLLNGDFMTGWHDIISRIRYKKSRDTDGCSRCERRHLCGFCPAFFMRENGSEDVPSEYLCAMGRHRHRLLMERNVEEILDAA